MTYTFWSAVSRLSAQDIARLEETIGRLRTPHDRAGLYGEGEQFTHAAAAALEKVFIYVFSNFELERIFFELLNFFHTYF